MGSARKRKKTILVAFSSSSDSCVLCEALYSEKCRLLRADNILSLINTLERHIVDMLIVDAEMPCVSMSHFLPFLRERYGEMKVIVAMKDYSAQQEVNVRTHKILYVLNWPINPGLLQSVVERGLSLDSERAVSV